MRGEGIFDIRGTSGVSFLFDTFILHELGECSWLHRSQEKI